VNHPSLALTLSLLVTLDLAPLTHAIEWDTDHDTVLATADDKQQPILLYFTATWCGYCRSFEKVTLADESVTTAIQPFLKARLDYDDDAYLASKYGIRGVPTVLLLNPKGQIVAQTMGYQSPQDFLTWFDRHAENVSPEVARQAEIAVDSEIKTIQTGLDAKDPAKRKVALDQLIAMFLESPDTMRDFTTETFTALAADNPALAGQYLIHRKLAVRLLASNVLRETLGNDFAFDPWQTGAARISAYKTWKSRLPTQ
jgi:thioredoxin-related protein